MTILGIAFACSSSNPTAWSPLLILAPNNSFLVNSALKNNLSSHFHIGLTREVLITLCTPSP